MTAPSTNEVQETHTQPQSGPNLSRMVEQILKLEITLFLLVNPGLSRLFRSLNEVTMLFKRDSPGV